MVTGFSLAELSAVVRDRTKLAFYPNVLFSCEYVISLLSSNEK